MPRHLGKGKPRATERSPSAQIRTSGASGNSICGVVRLGPRRLQDLHVRLIPRQPDLKAGSARRWAIHHRNGASVQVHDGGADGQAQASPAASPAPVPPGEPVEEPGPEVGGNPRSLIANLDGPAPIQLTYPEPHGPAGGAVLVGI